MQVFCRQFVGCGSIINLVRDYVSLDGRTDNRW